MSVDGSIVIMIPATQVSASSGDEATADGGTAEASGAAGAASGGAATGGETVAGRGSANVFITCSIMRDYDVLFIIY